MTTSIPRNPPVPELTDKQMNDIEKIVFCNCKPRPSDLLFIFGSTREDWSDVAQLCKRQLTPLILITGKGSPYSPPLPQTQSHTIRDQLLKHGVDPRLILLEDASTNTKENVIFGKKILEEKNTFPQSILFTCFTHHSGRCYRTLKKYFPNTHFSCFTYDGVYNDLVLSQKNWRQTAYTRERVYGEYLRIQRYQAAGDIAS